MAIKKYAKKVGRAIKRRYFKGKGYSRPKVQRMAKDIMMLKNVLNPEKKFRDTNVVTAVTNLYPDDPFVASFNVGGIPQGDDNNARNGRSIKYSSWHFNANIQLNGAGASLHTKFKLYFVQMKGLQPTATRANVVDRFFERSPLGATLTDFNSFRSHEHMKDFKILHVYSGYVRSESTTGVDETRTVSIHKKIRTHARWDASAIQEGEIYVIGIADRGRDASNDGLVINNYAMRVYWYDN